MLNILDHPGIRPLIIWCLYHQENGRKSGYELHSTSSGRLPSPASWRWV
jgi:hypothetical protein